MTTPPLSARSSSDRLLIKVRHAAPGTHARLFKQAFDERYPLGEELGSGFHKVAFEVVDRPERVVAVQREVSRRAGTGGPWEPGRLSKLVDEYRDLATLKFDWGVPVVTLHRLGTLDGRPAQVMTGYRTSSKDKNAFEAHTSGVEPLFTERTLEDLAHFRRAFDNGLVIRDFQALLGLANREASAGEPEVAVHDLSGLFNRSTLDEPYVSSYLKQAIERRIAKQEKRLAKLTDTVERGLEARAPDAGPVPLK